MQKKLRILQKVFDFTVWIFNHTNRLPRQGKLRRGETGDPNCPVEGGDKKLDAGKIERYSRKRLMTEVFVIFKVGAFGFGL